MYHNAYVNIIPYDSSNEQVLYEYLVMCFHIPQRYVYQPVIYIYMCVYRNIFTVNQFTLLNYIKSMIVNNIFETLINQQTLIYKINSRYSNTLQIEIDC